MDGKDCASIGVVLLVWVTMLSATAGIILARW